jgi:AraC-like DNA-binding protein
VQRLLHQPLPPLAEFIQIIWLWENYTQPHALERLLPDGTSSIVFNLHEDVTRIHDRCDHRRFNKFSGAIVSGVHSSYFVLDTAEQFSTLGVFFKPGGIHAFLAMPNSELANQHVALEDVWGPKAGTLRQRILETPTAEGKVAVVERALLDRLRFRAEHHDAMRFAMMELSRCTGPGAVQAVTERVGFSHRRFVQLFANQVGITPKAYSRIRRFQKVIELARAGGDLHWASLALAAGYYDQAHFIHDFREFSGLSPSRYLLQRSAAIAHVPIPDQVLD